MRAADKLEVAQMGFTPYEALVRSIMLSGGESWAMLVRGKVAAIGGIMALGLLTRAGVPWILTGNEVIRHPKEFWRLSKASLAVFRTRYALLTNVVDSRYETSIRWLRRLGFKVEMNDDITIGGVPFYRVTLRGAL